jgi:hypothetical protein
MGGWGWLEIQLWPPLAARANVWHKIQLWLKPAARAAYREQALLPHFVATCHGL